MAEVSFEKALDNLEKIVAAMEEGDLSLDKSLEQYEKGINLIRMCHKKLDESEKKIELIHKKANGEFETTDFDENENKPKAKAKTKASDKANDKEEGMLF